MKEAYLKRILPLEQGEDGGWLYVDKKEKKKYPVSLEQKERMVRCFSVMEIYAFLGLVLFVLLLIYRNIVPTYVEIIFILMVFLPAKIYLSKVTKIINELKQGV